MLVDTRISNLARQLLEYSIKLKKGDTLLLEMTDAPVSLANEIALIAAEKEADICVNLYNARLQRVIYQNSSLRNLENQARLALEQMQDIDAYIAVRAGENIMEMSDLDGKKLELISKTNKPVIDERVNNTRWTVLRWPSQGMAQQAAMSTDAFEDYYFDVCLLDYAKLRPAAIALQELMEATERVQIKSPSVDLSFSIKDIPAIVCCGERNIPDGEVFTAPVKDSVEGKITYNTPSIYRGVPFDKVHLEFSKGKIINASCQGNDKEQEKLTQILDADEGARYIGEFALGFNNKITKAIRDILFDEKIGGSFHFTPGQSYEKADNGNRSQIHWDLVCMQTPEHGGGEIYFDGKLIRKDGKFTPANLALLNS